MKLTKNYTLKELISFTGVDFIHQTDDIIRHGCVKITSLNSIVTIAIETQVIIIQIAINTDPVHLNVKNEFIRIKPGYQNRALGIQVLYQQVQTLSRYRFKKIYCLAEGNKHSLTTIDPEERFNGFITWAKAGFSMSRSSKKLFDHLLKKHALPIMPLHKLLLEKQLTLWADGKERRMSGRQYWIEYGSWWNGEFKLDENSENVKRLKDYLLGRLLKSKQKIYAIN